MKFTLNGQIVQVSGVSPTMTLLEWLRSEGGLRGTKEGCAEGDCGACSVALADPISPDGKPVWRSVNSCPILMPMLHGREVRTVEGLGGAHPAQAAMVEALGSQCGYCTPGFVMSLFEACHRRDLGPDDEAGINDQLCGNLCRCTGYRPIRDAAVKIAGTHPDDGLSADAAGSAGAVDYAHGDQSYHAPGDLPALFDTLDANPGARIVCGGTDVSLEVTKRHDHLTCVVSVEAIPQLRGISAIPGGWRVGATTLLADLEAWSADHCVPMQRMLRYFASRPIKNRATLGGNVCNASPIGDTPPVLLALNATAVIVGRTGERRVPIDAFFLGYRKTAIAVGEILAAIEIPDLPADARAASYKVSKRRELDISAVCASIVVRERDGVVFEARIAYGGMAATPTRAAHAEAALIGRPLDAAIEDAVLALDNDFQPIDDHRGSAWYRMTVARNLLRAFPLETAVDRVPRLPARHAGTVVLETP